MCALLRITIFFWGYRYTLTISLRARLYQFLEDRADVLSPFTLGLAINAMRDAHARDSNTGC